MEKQLGKENHFLGGYDYLHLGVLYLEEKKYQKAIEFLNKQIEEYDMAETRYYLALAHKNMGEREQYEENIRKAKELFLKDKKMHDPYNELFDQIYLIDIEKEINQDFPEK